MDHMNHESKLQHILLWASSLFSADSLKSLALVSHSVAECIHPQLFRFVTIESLHIEPFQLVLNSPLGWRHASLVRYIDFHFHITNKHSTLDTHKLVADAISSLPLLLHVAVYTSLPFNLAPVLHSLACLERFRSLELVGETFDISGVTEESLQAVGSKLERFLRPTQDILWRKIATASMDTLKTLETSASGYRVQDYSLDTIHFPHLKFLGFFSGGAYRFDIEPFISHHSHLETLICPELSPTTASVLHSLINLTITDHPGIPHITSCLSSFPRPHLLRTLTIRLHSQLTSLKTFKEALLGLSNLEQLNIGNKTRMPALSHYVHDESYLVNLELVPPHPSLVRIELDFTPFALGGDLPVSPPFPQNGTKSCLEALYVSDPILGSVEEDREIANNPLVRVFEETFLSWPQQAHASILSIVREYAEKSPAVERVHWRPCSTLLDPRWEMDIWVERDSEGKGGISIWVGFIFHTRKMRRNVRPEMAPVPGAYAVVYKQPPKDSDIKKNILTRSTT